MELTEAHERLLMLVALAPGPFRVKCTGAIRDAADACPLCAMANEMRRDRKWMIDAEGAVRDVIGGWLRVDIDEALVDIARAADQPFHPLRPLLMQVCNVEFP